MFVLLRMFVCPEVCERDMYGVTAKLKNWLHIGLEGVAYRQHFADVNTITLSQTNVFVLGLVSHHHAIVEQRCQSRAFQLMLLVVDLALGEDNH